jgi:hypothetical protein
LPCPERWWIRREDELSMFLRPVNRLLQKDFLTARLTWLTTVEPSARRGSRR